MSRAQVPFFSLNAGEVGLTALARIDLEKMRMAAESMVNFIPTVLGPMGIRPGMNYLSSTQGDTKTRLIPFVFNADTTSLLEISSSGLRVRNSDTLVNYVTNSTTVVGTLTGVTATYTRSGTTVTVTKTSHGLTNGTAVYIEFTSGGALSGWYTVAGAAANTFTVTTVATGTIATSNCTYYAGWSDTSTNGSVSFNGALELNSTKYSYARARQAVTVSGADQSKVHCVSITVTSGPIIFRIGSTAGGSEIISDQNLDEGNHFIAFTPGVGTVYLELEANQEFASKKTVTAVTLVKNTNLLVPTPWAEADLGKIRYAQSGSVVFVACDGYPQYKIERRGANSWGVAKYLTTGGPYIGYSGRRVKLKSSGRTGNVTITADHNFFNANMVGSVFQITHPTQRPTITFTGEDQYSDPIRVTGVGTVDRTFVISIGFVSSGTITLERAFGTPEGWTTVKDYTTSVSGNTNDAQPDTTVFGATTSSANGNVVYYRLSSRPGSGFSGSTSCYLSYDGGTTVGAFRIIGYTSPTSVSAEVVSFIANTSYTEDWRQGAWSNYQSWPSSVTFHDGRLWWAGLDKVYGSVSDDFYNFDPETEGDSGPIVRSVATGPVEGIGWMLSLQRLIVGTASSEVSIRSSSFDEPLTPTAFTARNASTVGSAEIQAAAVDSGGVYVQRNRTKVFELVYDVDTNDYGSRELTRLNQDVCSPGVSEIAAQRQPDTRLWLVKDDGAVAVLLYDRADSVVGWCRLVTDGIVESVAVLPTGNKDDVYFVVQRTINGATKRYVEKLNTDSTTERWLCDAAYNWTNGSPTTSVTGLTHLAGKTVTVFSPSAGGFTVAPATYTVSVGGTITLSSAQTNLIIGLPYTAQFKSVKLAYGSNAGTALTQRKRVDHLALVGFDVVSDGVKMGRDFSNLTSLSPIYKGKVQAAGTLQSTWDYDATSFNGGWDSDARICLQVTAPYPATIAGLVLSMKNNDRG